LTRVIPEGGRRLRPFWRLGILEGVVLRLLHSDRQPDADSSAELSPACTRDPLRALAARAGQGDEAASCTLLTSVGPAVLRAVRGVLGVSHPDVQDVCQEAAVALLLALPRFRASCTTLHFACRIAVLTAMSARRRARFVSVPPELADELGDPSDSAHWPAELADAARRRDALRQLLDELPQVQAEAIALHVVLGYTVEETAAAVGAPVNTVRSRLQRALSALRRRVDADSSLLEVVRGAHG